MQGKHTGAIRGLSIAAIALSGVSILTCLFCVIILAMVGSFFDGGLMESLSYEFTYGYDHYYGPMLANGMESVLGLTLGIIGLVVGWEVLTSVVTLVAGIIGLRNAANPAKLGSAFGWGIAGAVAAFLGGRIITMTLLITMAILAKKSQDDANVAYWQSVAAQQAQPYGHDVYAQPAPAPAPQQAYAEPAPASDDTAMVEANQTPQPADEEGKPQA